MHPKYYPGSAMPLMSPYAAPYPPPPHGHGFCRSCCHPIAQCVCHRDCRKVEKELLVQPKSAIGKVPGNTDAAAGKYVAMETTEQEHTKISALMELITPIETANVEEKDMAARLSMNNIQLLKSQVAKRAVAYGMQTAVIGGGCCVHLSIEYMPLTPLMTMPALSGAFVMDSKGTMLAWGKYFTEDGYNVKECVISTNPGAYLWVISVNSVTRVRWCEIISC
jgi:hypothetical protein